MTSIFDGMAGLLGDVFGAPVIYRPEGGPQEQEIQSVFRRAPVESEDGNGRPVLVVAPTWTVRRDLVPDIARGDIIEPGDGRVYEILNVQESGSPAADAFVVCELFEVAE